MGGAENAMPQSTTNCEIIRSILFTPNIPFIVSTIPISLHSVLKWQYKLHTGVIIALLTCITPHGHVSLRLSGPSTNQSAPRDGVDTASNTIGSRSAVANKLV